LKHTYNFVYPFSGAYTQNVENMWGGAKKRNKKENGTAAHLLGSTYKNLCGERFMAAICPAILLGILKSFIVVKLFD
jgi:hypothetical protein